MTPRGWTLTLLAIVAAAVPAVGRAQAAPAAAQQLYQQGVAEHRAGHFAAAARAFRRAFEQAPRPEYLYGWAQAERLGGNCPVAITLYRRLLALDLAGTQRAAGEHGIRACAGAKEVEVPAVPAPVAVVPPPAPGARAVPLPAPAARAGAAAGAAAPSAGGAQPEGVVEVRPTSRRAWYADPWGGSLLALGVAGVGTGIGCYVWAGSAGDSARDATHYPDYRMWADRWESRRLGAWVSIGVGVGFVVAAVIRYVVRARASRAPVALGPFPGGSAVTGGTGSVAGTLRVVDAGRPLAP